MKRLIIRKKRYVCNVCGKSLQHTPLGVITEGAAHIDIDWGYFSDKDGEKHRILICEKCYDDWMRSFKVKENLKA